MKKIILLALSIVLLLSGCMFVGLNPVSNLEVYESLVSMMRNNAETHTLEGCTRENTYDEVISVIGAQDISQAHLAYNIELLGSPVVMQCVFINSRGIGLSLKDMFFDIMPDVEMDRDDQIEALVTQMDAELGTHEYDLDDFDEIYSWDQNNCIIDLTVFDDGEDGGKRDSEAIGYISVLPGTVVFGIYPKCPDLFPYQLGTDIQTVYQNEKPAALPRGFEDSVYMEYTDDGIAVRLGFSADATGFKLREGRYNVFLNPMSFKNSLDYFDSLADDLEIAVGEPKARGYGIPEVFDDDSGYTYECTSGAQRLSAQDILYSGGDDYWLDITWSNIRFSAAYVTDADIWIEYPAEYLLGIPAKEFWEN